MYSIFLVFHFFVCIALIGLVLVQRGKGAEMGVAFSSGSSSGLFGSQGSSAFLVKLTTITAIIFFSNCLMVGIVHKQANQSSLLTEAKTN
jgi:preprotein translocase subunit SecG